MMIVKSAKFKMQSVVASAALLVLLSSFSAQVQAQATRTLTSPDTSENVNSSGFRLIVCDGPNLPPGVAKPANLGHTYVPCDFNGLMLEVQHLINIAMVLGVLVAIAAFSYMGFLYITGTPGNISKAHAIFPKVFWGFIIMITGWFIVYQILSWLTGNSGFSALLGTP